MRTRQAFALLAVLWILVGATIVALTVTLTAREAAAAAFNRKELARAEWSAEACFAAAREALAELTTPGGRGGRGAAPFDSIGPLLERAPVVRACPGDVRFGPVGRALDLNAVTGAMLGQILEFAAVPPVHRDSMVDAFLDWRDSDEVPRRYGCEAGCADERGEARPRNGRFASTRELALVRGFASLAPAFLDSVFTVEAGRVHLPTAPFAVLLALPGIGREGATELTSVGNAARASLRDLSETGQLLSPMRRDSLQSQLAELGTLATVVPDAWLLRVTSSPPTEGAAPPGLAVRFEARIMIGGSGARVIRRRFLP